MNAGCFKKVTKFLAIEREARATTGLVKARLLMISVSVFGTVFAAGETVPHRLRVLPVGDPPPFIQEVREDGRYEVAPPEGAVPPREVTVPSPAAGAAEDETLARLRLRLGQPSGPLFMPLPESGRVPLVSGAGSRWLDVPLHSSGASLALVWRGGKSWKDARIMVVPDDDDARREGNVHVVNLTNLPMAVVLGSEKIRLDPGRTLTRRSTGEQPAATLEILYPTRSGDLRLCHTATMERIPGAFRRIIIYAADGIRPRSPFKVLQLDEPS